MHSKGSRYPLRMPSACFGSTSTLGSVADRADVVIIGGGAVGTSIAYHLAERGAGGGVVLLERHTLGSGSTGRSAGGIRSQFSTEVNIRFSLESVQFWRRIAREVDYRETGYLFLATTEQQRQQFERNIALQNALGVPSRLVSPQDMGQLVPGMRVDDLAAGAYSSADALAGPNEAVQWFARHARERGVELSEGVEALGIDTRAERW